MADRLTYAKLPDLIGHPYPHPMLLCRRCGAEYSAHRGDYGAWRGDHPDASPRCGQCKTLLRLVVKVVSFAPYVPPGRKVANG